MLITFSDSCSNPVAGVAMDIKQTKDSFRLEIPFFPPWQLLGINCLFPKLNSTSKNVNFSVKRQLTVLPVSKSLYDCSHGMNSSLRWYGDFMAGIVIDGRTPYNSLLTQIFPPLVANCENCSAIAPSLYDSSHGVQHSVRLVCDCVKCQEQLTELCNSFTIIFSH